MRWGKLYIFSNIKEKLYHPILHRKVKTSDGIRTVAGLGTWTGWISSTEMDNAIKHGYTFNIHSGYRFEKAIIFKEYIEKLYTMRLTYDKSNPMNLVAKLLMNSLYGKFGMRATKTVVDIFDVTKEAEKEKYEETLDLYGDELITVFNVGDNFAVIQRNDVSNYHYSEARDEFFGLDVNVGIASAITASA